MRRQRRSNALRTNENELSGLVSQRTSSLFNSYVVRTKRNRQPISADNQNNNNLVDHGDDSLLQEHFRHLSVQHEEDEWPFLAPSHLHESDDELEEETNNDRNDTEMVETPASSNDNHEKSADTQFATQNNTLPLVLTVTNLDNISANEQYIVHVLQSGLKYAASWSGLVSFLSTHGRTRFPKELYQIYRETVITSSDNNKKLLSYSTSRQTQSKYFNGHCFPKHKILYFKCNKLNKKMRTIRPYVKATVSDTPDEQLPDNLNNKSRRKRPYVQTAVRDSRDVRECVKVILPSSWAKYDMAFHTSYKDIIDGRHHTDESQLSIERSPIINNRRISLGTSRSFWAFYEGVAVGVNCGTRITIPIDLNTTLPAGHSREEELREFDVIEKGTREDTCLDCIIGPQWCVSTPTFSDTFQTKVDETSLSADELTIYKLLNKSSKPFVADETTGTTETSTTNGRNLNPTNSDMAHRMLSIFPSDICTFLRPSRDANTNGRFVCLFISSYVSNFTVSASERVVWIDTMCEHNNHAFLSGDGQDYEQGINQLFFSLSIDVTAVPTVHKENKKEIPAASRRTSTPVGSLADGTKYATYRFALYADEFGTEGICGCYILLLGAAQHNRVSSAGVRVLSLVPKHQNVNKVLKVILDDILTGTIFGIPGHDPYGNRIQIFLDMPVVFGDYVKMSAITNTAGHSAICFCTYCKTQRNKSNTGPTYAYSTSTHCRRLGFMRCDERLNILTSLNLHSKNKKLLGLKTTSAEESSDIPLVYYAIELKKKLDGNLTLPLRPFSNEDVFFDSCLSTAVAPDHLLSGIIDVLIEACFFNLPNNEARRSIENEILHAAAENSLPTQGSFLVISSSGTFKGISSMTMSTKYVILFSSSHIFYRLKGTALDTQKIFHIPRILQDYIANFYFWPDISIDSFDDVKHFEDNNDFQYLARLQKLANEYTEEVGKHMRKYGESAVLNDRPNSHRLMELTVHTVPLFGHGKLTSELVLELTHAFFKSWFKDNTHDNSHITAVDHFVTRVWSVNLFILHNMWMRGTEEEQVIALQNLVRLFFGDIANVLDSANLEQFQDQFPLIIGMLDEFSDNLKDIMKPPVPRMLTSSLPIALLFQKDEWVPRDILKKPDINNVTSMAIDLFASHLEMTYQDVKESLVFYDRASLTVYGKYESAFQTYPFKTIYRGTPICVHVNDTTKTIVSSITNGHGKRIETVVNDVVQYKNNYFLFCCVLKKNGDGYQVDNSAVRIVKLQKGITRIGFVEDRDYSSYTSGTRSERRGLLGGGTFKLFFRKHGYPPCLG